MIVRRPSCPKNQISDVQMLATSKTILKMIRDMSWIFWGILGSPRIDFIALGSHGHVQKSRNHENEGFRFLPQPNRKVISPNRSRIIPRSFQAFSISSPWKWQNNAKKSLKSVCPTFARAMPFLWTTARSTHLTGAIYAWCQQQRSVWRLQATEIVVYWKTIGTP